MNLFDWLTTSLNRYRSPFQFLCLQNRQWECQLCGDVVLDSWMGFHASAFHGHKAGSVVIAPPSEYRRIPLH